MSMPACPKCGAIGTTGPKGKWRCTSEKCAEKQRESEEVAGRRNDKLECPKCGGEAREWNKELRCWSCGHILKMTKAVEKKLSRVKAIKKEAEAIRKEQLMGKNGEMYCPNCEKATPEPSYEYARPNDMIQPYEFQNMKCKHCNAKLPVPENFPKGWSFGKVFVCILILAFIGLIAASGGFNAGGKAVGGALERTRD